MAVISFHSNPNKFWKSCWLPALIIFITAMALYISSVSFDYVLDDQIVLTGNEFTKKGLQGIKDIFTTESMHGFLGEQKDYLVGARYRPLSIATFALEQAFLGLHPKYSHFINVLLYAFTGLLLFRILAMLFPIKKNIFWNIAFITTLLFILHPLHTEVIANVKGRDEILTFMCTLGSIYFSLKYIQHKRILWLIPMVLTYFAALLAKENALTFLAIIPITLYFFTKANFKQHLYVFLPLLVTAILYLFIRYQIVGYLLDPGKEITDIMNNPFYGLTFNEKMATVFYTLGWYIKLLVFPHPLTHDYYPYQVAILNWTDFRAILSLLFYVLLGIIAIRGLFKKSIIAYAILFYLATLSIVSNVFFTVGTFMNERFLYISSLGFCILVGWFFVEKMPKISFLKPKIAKLASIALVSIVSIFFIIKTLTRLPDWKNRMSLNKSAIKASPNSARANCFMGTALYELEYMNEEKTARKKELLSEISHYLNKSLEIYPSYFSALKMKSGIVAEQYKYDRDLDKLLDEFYSILQYKQIEYIYTYIEYLVDRADSGKLAAFCHKTGFLLFAQQQKDYGFAVKMLNYGLQAAPNNIQLLTDMGQVYRLAGNEDKATEYFYKAQQLRQ